MGALSIIHWLIVLFFTVAILVVPVIAIWRILKRLGLSPWLALLYYVPLANLIGLWCLAQAKWPGVQERLDAETFS